MEAREIYRRVMAGEDMRPQIWERNARLALVIGEAIANDVHPAEGCRKKNCVHGNEEEVRNFIGHAVTLQEEMVREGWA